MEPPPSKRSRRLNQMVANKKNQSEVEKRKAPLKVIKPTSGGKDTMVKPINALDAIVNVKEKVKKDLKKKTKGSSEPKKVTLKVLKQKPTAAKIETKDSSGGDDVDMDALTSASESVDVDVELADVVKANKKLVKVTENRCKDKKKTKSSTEVKQKESAYEIKRKKKSGESEVTATVKRTIGKQVESSSCHVDPKNYSAADTVEPTEAAGKDKVEANDENEDEFESGSGSSGDELTTDDDLSDVVNVRDVKPKKTADNINPKKSAAKVEVKSTDEKDHEMDSDTNASPSASEQIDANQHSSDGKIFEIVSRIENKLDNLVCGRVNEKRMYAIILRMPFDLVEDINQYNLDLEDVDLYLKFAKYFESVGGNNDGKIVCNILHLIATPDLLSKFDWQISSSKSFQAFKNIVKLIHTAAKPVCSDKFDMTVCGEVIKNVLRNARCGVYKK